MQNNQPDKDHERQRAVARHKEYYRWAAFAGIIVCCLLWMFGVVPRGWALAAAIVLSVALFVVAFRLK